MNVQDISYLIKDLVGSNLSVDFDTKTERLIINTKEIIGKRHRVKVEKVDLSGLDQFKDVSDSHFIPKRSDINAYTSLRQLNLTYSQKELVAANLSGISIHKDRLQTGLSDKIYSLSLKLIISTFYLTYKTILVETEFNSIQKLLDLFLVLLDQRVREVPSRNYYISSGRKVSRSTAREVIHLMLKELFYSKHVKASNSSIFSVYFYMSLLSGVSGKREQEERFTNRSLTSSSSCELWKEGEVVSINPVFLEFLEKQQLSKLI